MTFCTKCGTQNDEASGFCQNCGAKIGEAIEEALPEKGIMSKIEQSVYFRIARGSAWFFLLLAVVALVVTIVYLFPTATQLFGGNTKVSKDEIRTAIEADKTRKPFVLDSVKPKKFDPELMAKLDKEIYHVIVLLPSDVQNQYGGVDRMRDEFKDGIGYLENIKDKITLLQEMRSVIKEIPEVDRLAAVGKYLELKQRKEYELQQRKADAKTKLSAMYTVIISLIAIITSITMILVLLAIERNTRKVK